MTTACVSKFYRNSDSTFRIKFNFYVRVNITFTVSRRKQILYNITTYDVLKRSRFRENGRWRPIRKELLEMIARMLRLFPVREGC